MRFSLGPSIKTVLLYGSLVLFFTAISLLVAPVSSQTGTLRELASIPPHLLDLAAGGVVLGLVVLAISRRLDALLVIPAATILTDLDHLPSAFGMAQPIRPAHSIIFIIVAFVLVATIIKRLDLSFAAMSGFFVHLTIDTGAFPAFSPVSFVYYNLGSFAAGFAVLAVATALLAGYFGGRVSR